MCFINGLFVLCKSQGILTYLYKHLIDVNGVLGTGLDKYGMDGVGVVLGVLLQDFPATGQAKMVMFQHTHTQIVQFQP